jgi:hypothetical protein
MKEKKQHVDEEKRRVVSFKQSITKCWRSICMTCMVVAVCCTQHIMVAAWLEAALSGRA